MRQFLPDVVVVHLGGRITRSMIFASERRYPAVVSDEDGDDFVADEGGGDGEAGEHVQLTPEQEVTLRATMESIRRLSSPRIQPPKFTFPEPAFKNFAVVSRFAETQQNMVTRAIKPILDAQLARQKRIAGINSDIFKSRPLVQSNLNLIASQLTRNIDFGIAKSGRRLTAMFAKQQKTGSKISPRRSPRCARPFTRRTCGASRG